VKPLPIGRISLHRTSDCVGLEADITETSYCSSDDKLSEAI
jgi:hypothetical protein